MSKEIKYLVRKLGQDAVSLFLFLSISTSIGIVINQFRDKSLSFIYQSKEQRMGRDVAKLSSDHFMESSAMNNGVLSLAEFRSIFASKQDIILDARPEVFYEMGHIPTALSLPRDDFEKSYQKLKMIMEIDKGRSLIVYCSGNSCEDSELVRQALMHLGYTKVFRFRGGWSDWTAAGLPIESSSQ